MTALERNFEVNRVRDLLAANPSINMNAQLDYSHFQSILDRLVDSSVSTGIR